MMNCCIPREVCPVNQVVVLLHYRGYWFIFQGIDKAGALLAACFIIWSLLRYLSVSILQQFPLLSKPVFFGIFVSLYILSTYFWLEKNDIFRPISEPMMIFALDNYYSILNRTVLFWIPINFYADNTFLEFLCLPSHLVNSQMIWQTVVTD